MRVKWVLNSVLLAALASMSVKFRGEWGAMRERERVVLSGNLNAAPSTAFVPIPVVPPVTAAAYTQIALRNLFDPSRNPTSVVDAPPPPPPPVMPSLPLCYGVLNFGTGATAILAENDKSPHQLLSPGAMIGQFKLMEVDTEGIVLEWNGQQIRKELIEGSGKATSGGCSSWLGGWGGRTK